jgi:hypothetical protein
MWPAHGFDFIQTEHGREALASSLDAPDKHPNFLLQLCKLQPPKCILYGGMGVGVAV